MDEQRRDLAAAINALVTAAIALGVAQGEERRCARERKALVACYPPIWRLVAPLQAARRRELGRSHRLIVRILTALIGL